MVCCCLISARIELERTQDMHNGTLARRSHIPSRLRGTLRLSFGPDIESVRAGLDRLDGLIRSV